MNKKYISLLLIFGILVSGLGLVTANDTITDDVSTTSSGETEPVTPVTTDADSSVTDDSTKTTEDNSTNNDTNITTENITTADNNTQTIEINDVIEIINATDDNEFNALIAELKAKNTDGKFDAVLKVLTSDKIIYEDLYNELVDLDDESFSLFVEIIESIPHTPSSAKPSQVKTLPSKDSVSTFLEKTGINNVVNNVVNTFTPKNTPNTEDSSRIIHFVPGPQIIDLVCEALDQYFKGNISFEDLMAELETLDVDTSLIKQNDDGSLTVDGITVASVEDYLKAVTDVPDNSTDTDNSTSTDNSTDVGNSTGDDSTATSDDSTNDDSQADVSTQSSTDKE